MIKKIISKGNKSGFTLIEILIVVAIIGILLVSVLIFMDSSRRRSKDAAFKSTVRSISPAVELCCTSEGIIKDKAVGAGDSSRVCSVEAQLVYPNDDNVGSVFAERYCDNAGGYRVIVRPGDDNSGNCESAVIEYGKALSFEGC
ncbi:type II secretion system protein [Patescibacteria group bacterium]